MNMKTIVRSKIFENPNSVIPPEIWKKKKEDYNYTPSYDDIIQYNEKGNIPFGYYGGKYISGKANDYHSSLRKKAIRQGLINDKTEDRQLNSGRVFPSIKVISFWIYPKDYEELISVIKDIEANSDLNILNDPEWLIEIPSGEYKKQLDDKKTPYWGVPTPRVGHVKFIPIDEYKGGHKRSEKELNMPHELSPTDREKFMSDLSDEEREKIEKERKAYLDNQPGYEKLKKDYYKQRGMGDSYYPRLKKGNIKL